MNILQKTAAVLLALCLLTGFYCGVRTDARAENTPKGPVTIATMIDSEGAIIGSMMLLLLRQAGFDVVDRTEFGTPEILRMALVAEKLTWCWITPVPVSTIMKHRPRMYGRTRLRDMK